MNYNSVSNANAVALLAEGVDRNFFGLQQFQCIFQVALLAEGVDRNCPICGRRCENIVSPSSRRAWIEIGSHHATPRPDLRRPPRGGRG